MKSRVVDFIEEWFIKMSGITEVEKLDGTGKVEIEGDHLIFHYEDDDEILVKVTIHTLIGTKETILLINNDEHKVVDDVFLINTAN